MHNVYLITVINMLDSPKSPGYYNMPPMLMKYFTTDLPTDIVMK